MVTTQHWCAACGSEPVRPNGSSQGHAKYPCKGGGRQARFVPASVAKAAQCAQVAKLLVERNSQRSIARVPGVARTMLRWPAKKSLGGPAAAGLVAAETGTEAAVGGARTR